MKDYDEEMAEYFKTDDFSCLAAPAAGQEVLALPNRAGHLWRLRGPGHLHLLCLLRRGLLDQDPHPAGTGAVVGVYNIYKYLPLSTTIYHYLPSQAPLLLGRARRHPPPRRQGLALLLRDCVRRQRRLGPRLPCPLHLVSQSKLQIHVQKARECDGDIFHVEVKLAYLHVRNTHKDRPGAWKEYQHSKILAKRNMTAKSDVKSDIIHSVSYISTINLDGR